MKKSYIYTMLLAVGVMLGITACSSNNDWQPGSVSGQQVFFPNSMSSIIELDETTNSYDITIQRYVADEATTVNLQLTDTSNIFSIPSSVAFAQGQKETTFTMTYDPSKFTYEKKYGASIKIADANLTTPYGITSYDFAAVIPTPLRLLGTGTWEDAYMFGGTLNVKIYQNTLNENIFRIMLDYPTIVKEAGEEPSGLKSDYVDVTVLQVGDELAGTTITKPGQLYFTPFDMSYANSTGEMIAYHPVDFGWTSEGYIGTSYIDAYQDNGLPGTMILSGLILVDFEGGKGWAPCNSDAPIAVVTFPGFTPADYSAEVEYAGIFTNAANEIFAVGNLALGTDATDVKAIVMEANADAEAVADAIAAGDLEATSVEAGQIYVPIAEGLSGKLQLIVAVINGKDVKNVVTAGFEYYGGGKTPWESIGIGYYTDDYIVSYYGKEDESGNFIPYDPETYQVEIEANTETPGLYRMKNAYAPLAAMFGLTGGEKDIEVNAEDPAGVYILNQLTGFNAGNGEYSIESYGGYLIAQNPTVAPADVIAYFAGRFGTLANGEITFPTVTTKSGIDFQGYLYRDGELVYYGGTTLASKVVLPTASAAVKAKAQRAAAATDFARRLNGHFHQNKSVTAPHAKVKRFLLKDKMLKK